MVLQKRFELHGKPVASLIRSEGANAGVSGIAENLRKVWQHAFSLLSREHILSIADQAVVSGTSFVTTLLVARYSDAGQLGVYAVGISVLVSLLAFQDSLILQPYTIQRHSPEFALADRTGASLILSFVFSGGSILALTVAATGFLEWEVYSGIIVMTFAVAGALPFVLTREFVRRVAIARLELGRAVALDLAAGVTQLTALAWLGLNGRMSAVSACAALGGASAVAAAGSLYFMRSEFTLRMQSVPAIFRQTWALGKWLLAGRITVQVQGYITYWIAMTVAGAAVTGVYAACMSIVNVINPMIFALSNVMAPKLVLAWKDGGGPGLWREAIRNTMLISATMAAFTLTIWFGGEQVMQLLFQGSEYAGHGQTLTVLALAAFAAALGMPASFGLATIERPRAIVVVGTVGAILTAVLVGLLMMKWDLLGAAYGLLAGNLVGALGRWAAFFILVPLECGSALVVPVLQSFTKVTDADHWTISRVGGGEQADVFLIDAKGPLPTCGEFHTFVAKLYKPEGALTFDRVHAQFTSLSNLHAALDGLKINGWTILVPRPLYVCKSPLALVMTAVPGRYIDAYASKDDALTSKVLHEAAGAFARAMEQCWSTGQRHGDLGLRNALFDIEAKTISLIDAGTRESCRTCSEVAKFPSPAASDLAHVLCEVVRDVTDLIGSPPARMGKEVFVENVLRAVMAKIGSLKEKRRLLSEIWDSLQEHLAECLEPSWSLKGVSHGVVKKIALNRARSMLERVVSDNGICAKHCSHEFDRSFQLR